MSSYFNFLQSAIIFAFCMVSAVIDGALDTFVFFPFTSMGKPSLIDYYILYCGRNQLNYYGNFFLKKKYVIFLLSIFFDQNFFCIILIFLSKQHKILLYSTMEV